VATQVNAVELIKDRLGIVEALSIYAGADFTKTNLNREKTSIKCPFHSDSSPSFTVYLKDQRFRCWTGCNDGKPGDVIDVVRIAYNLSTAEAIKHLRYDLHIDSVGINQETIMRIAEKRRELEQIKIDREALDWTVKTLQ
jgi:DNA primase